MNSRECMRCKATCNVPNILACAAAARRHMCTLYKGSSSRRAVIQKRPARVPHIVAGSSKGRHLSIVNVACGARLPITLAYVSAYGHVSHHGVAAYACSSSITRSAHDVSYVFAWLAESMWAPLRHRLRRTFYIAKLACTFACRAHGACGSFHCTLYHNTQRLRCAVITLGVLAMLCRILNIGLVCTTLHNAMHCPVVAMCDQRTHSDALSCARVSQGVVKKKDGWQCKVAGVTRLFEDSGKHAYEDVFNAHICSGMMCCAAAVQ